jgi:hypothetical protein
MVTWVMLGLLAQAPMTTTTAAPTTSATKAKSNEAPLVTAIHVRNEMGNRFALVEARLVVDGVEVSTRTAPKDEELPRQLDPLQVVLPPGPHVMTAQLVFRGRNTGPFRYLDEMRYRVDSTLPFRTGPQLGPATVDVVARERGGVNRPLEARPELTLAAVNTPAQPQAAEPAPTSTQKPGLQPASTTTTKP